MKNLSEFIQDFLKNSGQYYLFSLLFTKACSFFISLYIIHLLSVQDFGILNIVASVFLIFSAFTGFGNSQSLLRYGSVTENEEEKKNLSAYLFRTGFSNQLILTFIFVAVSFWYWDKYTSIFWIFLFFGVRLVGQYFWTYIQTYLRIHHNNKEFGRVNNIINLLSLVLVFVLTYFFQLKGYLVANAVLPFLSLFWFKKEIFQKAENFRFSRKEIWNYAYHSSGVALLSEALFSVDILMLGFFLNENAVADYRVAILIPANIAFLSQALLQSDFPVIAKNIENKNYLVQYIKNYYRIFIPVCLLIFILGYFFSRNIFGLFFSEKYASNDGIFLLLLGAFCLSMLFRTLYGYMLSAVGLMKVNTVNAVLSLLILIGSALFLLPKFGVTGMVYAMASMLVLSGIFLTVSFSMYLKKLK